MTTVVLEIPPLTLKPDESPWQNKEVTFLVNIPIALNQQGTQKEKFTVFRYENEGYENFLIWKRALEAFIDEANLLAQPAQKFKFVTRALMGATKDEWKQTNTRALSTLSRKLIFRNTQLRHRLSSRKGQINGRDESQGLDCPH